jgi:preprotein translocase subunit SecG
MTINKNKSLFIFGLITALLLILVVLIKPISQNNAYNEFSDGRIIWGIPNFFNVISNLPFIIIGTYGFYIILKASMPATIQFIYGWLFLGIIMTGLGSGFYHWTPANEHLVYDRIPMTIIFMSFFSATVAELIDQKWGGLILLPLLLLGIFSVLWWYHTESLGQGDLRLYGFVQYYPMLAIPLVIFLFPSQENKLLIQGLKYVIIWYVFAKICEHFDEQIFQITGILSGHSLKHIAAAMSTLIIVSIFKKKYVVE